MPKIRNSYYMSRKKLNTPTFNKMAKKRREKAKAAAKSRKRNR